MVYVVISAFFLKNLLLGVLYNFYKSNVEVLLGDIVYGVCIVLNDLCSIGTSATRH
jgi:hypothetical protein